jgi:hypothetical protein
MLKEREVLTGKQPLLQATSNAEIVELSYQIRLRMKSAKEAAGQMSEIIKAEEKKVLNSRKLANDPDAHGELGRKREIYDLSV